MSLTIIDRRPDNAQSFVRIRRHPTYEEVAALFKIGVDHTHGAAVTAAGEWYWRVAGFSLNEGPVVYRAEARDANNNPLPGVRIVRHWPGAPAIHNDPHLYSGQGVVGVTEFGGDKRGAVEFTYTGGSVTGEHGGPDSFWVISPTSDGKYRSDRAYGLGWWGEFNHFNPSPFFQLTQAGGEPEPEPDPKPDPDPAPGPQPPNNLDRFVVLQYFAGPGWTPVLDTSNLELALEEWQRRRAGGAVLVNLMTVLAQ